ncbi:MAG: PorT family protein [Pedobacter sp.]|nr:MAG: PorT family protein [Pedobacter sp.]
MRKLYFLLVLLSVGTTSRAQLWGGGVDDENYHFGFAFQYVSSELKILKNKDWRLPFFDAVNNTYVTDELSAIYAKPSPGFGVGFVFNYRLSNNADVRITPTLIFNDRIVYYKYVEPPIYNTSTSLTQRTIQSTMAEFPFGIKLKSDRRKNIRAYILGGGKYSLDIASKKKLDDLGSSPVDKLLKTKKNFFSYEAAVGLDLYFENFKLSPEVKLSYSVKDVLIHDNHPYATPIDKMMLRHFTFSLFVE